MKVVMAGPYPEPGRQVSGGVERVIDTLLPELAREVELTLVVPSARCDAETDHQGVRTIYLKRSHAFGSLAYWTADARRLAKAVEAIAPDLVHLQGVAGVGRFILAPRLLTLHGIIHRDFVASARRPGLNKAARYGVSHILRTVEAHARRQIGNVVTISPYAAEILPDIAGLRQFPIPNPIDRVFCGALPAGTSLRPRCILSVGRISPLKNTAQALAIAAETLKKDPFASYAVFGTSPDQAYLSDCEALANRSGVQRQIKFAGPASPERLRAELDRSSVLLITSKQENAPVVIAEAHARGVAVVAPGAFGIKTMITPGENGFFLPESSDIAQGADVLRQALDHDWDRDAIAAQAQSLYSPARIAALTLDAYRQVVAQPKADLVRKRDSSRPARVRDTVRTL